MPCRSATATGATASPSWPAPSPSRTERTNDRESRQTPAMDVFEAIRTTRAMRRLDPDRDVSDADLLTIVEAATKGPSGSNAQPARWMIVKDPDKRRRLGEIYRECWLPVRQMYLAGA